MSTKLLQLDHSKFSCRAPHRFVVFRPELLLVNHNRQHLIHKSFTVFPQGHGIVSKGLSFFDEKVFIAYNPPTQHLLTTSRLMPTRARRKVADNLLLFPLQDTIETDIAVLDIGIETDRPLRRDVLTRRAIGGIDELDVVLCGTYRKDTEGLRRSFEQLKDLGFNVLSPSNVDIASEQNGFVYMHGEQTETPEKLELRHLEAIQRARLVWLHAPDGYVGPTAALELGFAKASGIPIFSASEIGDEAFRKFVTVVSSPTDVVREIASNKIPPPPPALTVFQNYYKRAALQRGYERESTQNCLLLMVEEVGELARALRKKERLTRHGAEIKNAESLELADVFMYVIHMANILKIDLGQAVQQKELLNIAKLLHGREKVQA